MIYRITLTYQLSVSIHACLCSSTLSRQPCHNITIFLAGMCECVCVCVCVGVWVCKWVGGGVGILRISSDGDDRMGAKSKTQKNPYGFQKTSQKPLDQKINPQKSLKSNRIENFNPRVLAKTNSFDHPRRLKSGVPPPPPGASVLQHYVRCSDWDYPANLSAVG